MTGDELERAIDFLLKSQAKHDARIEQLGEHLARTDEQIAQTNQQLGQTNQQLAQTNQQLEQTNAVLREYMEMHGQLVQVVTRTFEAQAKINDTFRAAVKETNGWLVRLAESVERHVREGHGGAG